MSHSIHHSYPTPPPLFPYITFQTSNKFRVYISTSSHMDSLYSPLDVIGNGTFGVIRKVIRLSDDTIFARKDLNYSKMDEQGLIQLSSEVNILQNLGENEHIVRYVDRFVDKKNTMLYILMEYCEGGDLSGLIGKMRREGSMIPEDVVWSYFSQLIIALSDCHSSVDAQGRPKEVILHRDIKPDNVFLDSQNNLKLGDFGLSKAISSAAFTNTYVGTPYYMSPELLSGSEYSKPADIWSLGCLVYEMCAWHPPFHEARTQVELTKMINSGKIPDLPKGYSSTLGSVIRSMLRLNPKNRPTIEQLKTLEPIKLQLKIKELRKLASSLKVEQQTVREREVRLDEAEKRLREREEDLERREREIERRESEARGRCRACGGGLSSSAGTTISSVSGGVGEVEVMNQIHQSTGSLISVSKIPYPSSHPSSQHLSSSASSAQGSAFEGKENYSVMMVDDEYVENVEEGEGEEGDESVLTVFGGNGGREVREREKRRSIVGGSSSGIGRKVLEDRRNILNLPLPPSSIPTSTSHTTISKKVSSPSLAPSLLPPSSSAPKSRKGSATPSEVTSSSNGGAGSRRKTAMGLGYGVGIPMPSSPKYMIKPTGHCNGNGGSRKPSCSSVSSMNSSSEEPTMGGIGVPKSPGGRVFGGVVGPPTTPRNSGGKKVMGSPGKGVGGSTVKRRPMSIAGVLERVEREREREAAMDDQLVEEDEDGEKFNVSPLSNLPTPPLWDPSSEDAPSPFIKRSSTVSPPFTPSPALELSPPPRPSILDTPSPYQSSKTFLLRNKKLSTGSAISLPQGLAIPKPKSSLAGGGTGKTVTLGRGAKPLGLGFGTAKEKTVGSRLGREKETKGTVDEQGRRVGGSGLGTIGTGRRGSTIVG